MRQVVREAEYNTVYGPATKLQRQNRIGELTAIPPDKRTDAQNAELKWQLTTGKKLDATHPLRPHPGRDLVA